MNEIKPCPFCGSTEISEGEAMSGADEGPRYKQTGCESCGALGPRAEVLVGDDIFDDASANEAWNRRATCDKEN
jgi:Lar family restriction alleviation protein